MNYLPREGIERVTICGTVVLVPTRIAGSHCRSIRPLNLFGTFVWSAIEKDDPPEKVLELARIFSKKTDQEILERIEKYCQMLCAEGFAVPKEPDAQDNAPPPAPGSGDANP